MIINHIFVNYDIDQSTTVLCSRTAAIVSGYVGVDIRLQQSDFSLRVTLIQCYLRGKPQVKHMLQLQNAGHKPKSSEDVAY